MVTTCRWAGCGHTAPTLEALVVHLEDAHVGHVPVAAAAAAAAAAGASPEGRPDRQLRCLWDGCWREAPYSERTKLVQHLRAHTKEKPFQCPMPNCGMRFSVRSNLVAHGKRLHGRVLSPIVWSARRMSTRGPLPLSPPPEGADAQPALLAAELHMKHAMTGAPPALPPLSFQQTFMLGPQAPQPPLTAALCAHGTPHCFVAAMPALQRPPTPSSANMSDEDEEGLTECSSRDSPQPSASPTAQAPAAALAPAAPPAPRRKPAMSPALRRQRKLHRLEEQLTLMTQHGERLRGLSANLNTMLTEAGQLVSREQLTSQVAVLQAKVAALESTMAVEAARALQQLSSMPAFA